MNKIIKLYQHYNVTVKSKLKTVFLFLSATIYSKWCKLTWKTCIILSYCVKVLLFSSVHIYLRHTNRKYIKATVTMVIRHLSQYVCATKVRTLTYMKQ